MKGMALADRHEKRRMPGIFIIVLSITRVAADLLLMSSGPTSIMAVCEGLTKVSEKFASPEHIGPKQVADF